MPIGCVLFLFYYLCSEFLEIILKEMRGLAIIFRFFMLLVLLLPVVALCPVKAETTSEGPILIVTSYNPETRSISDNLSAFMDEYRQRWRQVYSDHREYELQEFVRGLSVEIAYGLHPW